MRRDELSNPPRRAPPFWVFFGTVFCRRIIAAASREMHSWILFFYCPCPPREQRYAHGIFFLYLHARICLSTRCQVYALYLIFYFSFTFLYLFRRLSRFCEMYTRACIHALYWRTEFFCVIVGCMHSRKGV